ncbi:alginate O-acetyltransferase AlgX-related protein [Anaerophilus nitritogenes]|uniref:alginate O-acetyltransferase AlgX-related protein n=1 Tax=Anaerophilus nitritogenes TaxID=2498136 RepID=UPI00101CD606|nr:hypothetical protein [Anaerophilus nitritogenes]
MKHFFMKKYIFSGIFLFILFAFGIMNFIYQMDKMNITFEKYGKIINLDDIKKLISKVEDTANDQLLSKMRFIEIYGYLQKLMGKNEINNWSYVKDQNGYIHYGSFYQEDDKELKEYAKQIRRLKENVQSKGTKILFMNPPGKYVPDISKFNKGIPIRDTNQIQDEFLLYLHNNGVETLDLRKPILESGLPYEKLFYKTDHHWTIEASFLAFCIIVEDMESRYGIELDPTGFYRDLNNYHIYQYKKSMLGSMGRNVGINYSDLDDFTLITPKFETDLIWEAKDLDGDKKYKKGSFEEAILQLQLLASSNIYSISKYDTYIETINPWDKITNNNNPNGLKILCIRDSYFSPTLSFLAPLCSEIHMIWPLATSNEVNIEKYINENYFDYIFIELYPHNIKKEAFTFFKMNKKIK